jgi:hypothetical protein
MMTYASGKFIGCRLELSAQGKCQHCGVDSVLIPFARLSEKDDRRYTESDFTILCSGCHFQHAQFRELKHELLPYWFKVAMRLRDYVWPEPDPVPFPLPKQRKTKFNPQLDLL